MLLILLNDVIIAEWPLNVSNVDITKTYLTNLFENFEISPIEDKQDDSNTVYSDLFFKQIESLKSNKEKTLKSENFHNENYQNPEIIIEKQPNPYQQQKPPINLLKSQQNSTNEDQSSQKHQSVKSNKFEDHKCKISKNISTRILEKAFKSNTIPIEQYYTAKFALLIANTNYSHKILIQKNLTAKIILSQIKKDYFENGFICQSEFYLIPQDTFLSFLFIINEERY